jgi:hypothetical protein
MAQPRPRLPRAGPRRCRARGHGELAAELGISEKEANDATYEDQSLLADGFDAYVLARMAFSRSARAILSGTAWQGPLKQRLRT